MKLEDVIDGICEGCKNCKNEESCDMGGSCYKAKIAAVKMLSGMANAYIEGATDALDEVEEKLSRYGTIWMEFSDDMTVDEITYKSLQTAKDTVRGIIRDVRTGIC